MRSKMRRLMAIFQLRTIDGSLFFKGHFSFHYCVPLIVGAVCRSLFLLWERLCGINASSPWPPHFAFSARQLHPRRTCLEWTCTLDQTPNPPFMHAKTSSPLEGHRRGHHKVEDWRAISGRVFPIDGGTTSQSSKLQDNALSPTTGSGHVAVMHGGKQAPWHHSPDPDISGDLQLRVPSSPFRPS